MEGLSVALVIAAAIVSRPLEARLWRAGRLSDRAAALLLLARFPIVCALFALIARAEPLIVVGITLVALLPGVLLYGFTLDFLRERRDTGSRPVEGG